MFGYNVLTVAEVAKEMKVSQKTVYRWIESGQLRVARFGRKTYRVFEDDLKKFIKKHFY
jgi:excisionase family DNA binding protein